MGDAQAEMHQVDTYRQQGTVSGRSGVKPASFTGTAITSALAWPRLARRSARLRPGSPSGTTRSSTPGENE